MSSPRGKSRRSWSLTTEPCLWLTPEDASPRSSAVRALDPENRNLIDDCDKIYIIIGFNSVHIAGTGERTVDITKSKVSSSRAPDCTVIASAASFITASTAKAAPNSSKQGVSCTVAVSTGTKSVVIRPKASNSSQRAVSTKSKALDKKQSKPRTESKALDKKQSKARTESKAGTESEAGTESVAEASFGTESVAWFGTALKAGSSQCKKASKTSKKLAVGCTRCAGGPPARTAESTEAHMKAGCRTLSSLEAGTARAHIEAPAARTKAPTARTKAPARMKAGCRTPSSVEAAPIAVGNIEELMAYSVFAERIARYKKGSKVPARIGLPYLNIYQISAMIFKIIFIL